MASGGRVDQLFLRSHDGSAATLEQVVATYNARRSLGLTAQQSADLVQYLKSL
jgi:cytochrome c peroxidase